MGILRNMADMIADVRKLSDMEDTDYVSDDEITGYINDANREATMILGESYEDWNLSSDDITTVAGTRDYGVAADFIRLRKVMYVRDSGLSTEREYPLRRANWSETDGGPLLERIPRRFRLQGSNIRLFPMPQAVLDYRYYYLAAPTTLTKTQLSVEFQYGLDRFCVWDAVVKCLIKEKSPSKEATNERDRHLAMAVRSADNRDASEAMTVQDVQYGSNDDWWDLSW